MRTLAWIATRALLVPGLSLLPASAQAVRAPTGDLELAFGVKQLERDPWQSLRNHPEFGATLALKRASWPLFVSMDLHYSYTANSEYDPNLGEDVLTYGAGSVEFGLGLRKVFYTRRLKIGLGGGIAFLHGVLGKDTLRVTPGQPWPDGTGAGWGPWIGASLGWRYSKGRSFGLNARYSRCETTLYDERVEIGGVHLLATFFGVTWPRDDQKTPSVRSEAALPER